MKKENSPERDVAPPLRCEEFGDFSQNFSVGASRIVEARRVYYRNGSPFAAGLTAELDLDCLASGRLYEDSVSAAFRTVINHGTYLLQLFTHLNGGAFPLWLPPTLNS